MYYLVKIKEKVRVPPKEFSEKLDKTILQIVQQEYEGLIDEDIGLIVAVIEIDNVGQGKVIGRTIKPTFPLPVKQWHPKEPHPEIIIPLEVNDTTYSESG